MGWAKVDDKLHSHPKVARASCEAMGLWVLALSWTRDYRTDGFVPAGQVARLGAKKAYARSLIDAGLWTEVDGGYQFHDFTEWNPSSEEQESREGEVSEKRREAGKRGAAKRWGRGNGGSNSMASDVANGMANDLFANSKNGNGDGKDVANGWQPDSPSPSPSPKEKDSLPSRQDQARGILEALNQARLRVFPRTRGYSPSTDNLKPILDRLKAGNTVEDCLHVIAVGEENAKREPNGPGALYFTAVNLFSPKSFGFKLSQQAPNAPRLSLVASPSETKPAPAKTATQRALEREKREEAEALARLAEKGEAS